MELYQKNRDKSVLKAGWKLIHKDDSGGLVESEIEVRTIKEKSFFNFFWLCFADGLKKPSIKYSF
jgi:hypothetical protein